MYNEEEKNLMDKAREAACHAYSPYSHFKVGAAILTEKGNIYQAANIENASYSLTICAERNAATQAVYHNDINFKLIAIFVDSEIAFPPCGACRQFLAEFGDQCEVIYFNNKESNKVALRELLPHSFSLKNKEKEGVYGIR
ncbi:MAG TPA: cytidine deaminase [Candidatus Cloacimonadota bacterium]|nr:cytidine deaminase [Candidatus Cloacimonadota bacterium]